jgi:hypothetical protein
MLAQIGRSANGGPQADEGWFAELRTRRFSGGKE